MPFTPFHFGPALLLKGAVPRHVSFLAFVASQVVIDLESLYYLVQRQWPVHRALHTFAVATPVGILSGLAVWAVFPRLVRLLGVAEASWLRSETALAPALVGGFAGGASHPLLDGIMHTDIRPFSPFSAHNPLLGVVGLEALHLGCIACGVVGLILVLVWRLSSGPPA